MLLTRLIGANFKLTCLLLGAVCLAACTRPPTDLTGSSELPQCCQGRYPVAMLAQTSTAQLGREYQQLKRRKCPACSRYGSDLQKLMKELGTRLDGQPRAVVVHAMGRPDEATDSVFIYHWRYRHDYLRFRLAANGTAASSWYYALE